MMLSLPLLPLCLVHVHTLRGNKVKKNNKKVKKPVHSRIRKALKHPILSV